MTHILLSPAHDWIWCTL